MKAHNVTLAIATVMAVVGVVQLDNYWAAQNWHLEVKTRTPIYKTDDYPYGSQSLPNKVIGYLNPGEKPNILGMDYGKEWPYWIVRLSSGQKGYLFAPDVEFKRK
jgi:hypothetical protein